LARWTTGRFETLAGRSGSARRKNLLQHPDSSNAWDSLGEAYMRRGDTKSAIEHYQRSLKLNPANTNAVKMLEKLNAK
jgi:cytochrome c-type biogenesis protein CcmH/NrfG